MVNQTLFGGLWFEYVYSTGYKGENPYDCASWTMLAPSPSDTESTTDSYDFDVIFHALNQTTNKTIYNQHKVICGKPGSTEALSCRRQMQEPKNSFQQQMFKLFNQKF